MSVLGSTLTLKGENTFVGAISQEEGNTTIALAEGATLDVGSYVYTLGGSLALSAGSTFKFGALASGTVVENAALGGTIVPPASGKANLELTTALADGTSVTVFDYYTGSAESFTLVVPGDVDATHYTLVCEDGHLVVKCAQPVHEGDAGTMTTSGSDSITIAQGARPNSTMVTVSGGTAPYEWSCPAATYATTRETATFDGTSGTTELSYRQRLGDLYDRNLVDLGFDFPFAGTLSREVLVNLNGSISIRRSGISNIGKICLLGSDCPNFATANDIYVSRAEGSATIRFGRRVAVTLSADGKIRVAYGPLAEGAEKRYMPVDVIVMLYAAYDPVTAAQIEERVARFEAENGEYNGINDVVFTPTGAIPYGLHPEFNGATAKVCGTIGTVCASAGAYPVTFRCVDANGYVIEKVVTVNVTGSSSMPSATASPSLMADGVCHITYGDSQTFTVSGLSGVSAENCSWYEDDVLKGSGMASYTFVTATRPRPLLPPNIFSPKAGDTNHTRLVSCRVTDPVYGTVTLASWQVIVNTTYYIDASVVDDAANGTEAHPYRTFPEMSYQAFAGDTFLVKPGKYKTPFTAPDGWAVTLRSTGGADVTLITVDAADKAAFIQKDAEGASRAATVEGFTLVNAGGRAAYGGTLVNCVLRDSMLLADGGMDDDDLGYGGGAYGSRLVNCLVSNCSAVWGGGVANCELRNCTVVGCFADELGGGMDGQSVAYNTALWGNCAGSDGHDSNATESTPVPGYILPRAPETHSCIFEADPMLFADSRPMTGSPCLGAGDRSYLADVPGASFDLAGDSRSTSGNVTVGAYENAVEAGACRIMVKTTGAGTVLEAPYLDVDYGASATFRFRGRPAATVLTNGVLAAENVTEFVWPDVVKPGELSVAFTAVELYVDATSGSRENDGLSWATAKMTILDAINSAGNGDIIHVKPGVYGSIVVSRISDLTDLRIVSTEGRDVTVIDAQHIGSCFDVSLDWVHNAAWERHGIVLEGFTLQNGRATGALGGGGACGGTLKDCIIENCESIGQFTSTDTARGGGASGSVLVNCIVRNCRAGKAVSEGTWYSSQAEGGGVYGGSAEKCEIYGNSCWGETRAEGPGTYDTVLRDCYVYNNKIGTYSEREQTLPAEDAALNTAGDAVAIRVATREPTTSYRPYELPR